MGRAFKVLSNESLAILITFVIVIVGFGCTIALNAALSPSTAQIVERCTKACKDGNMRVFYVDVLRGYSGDCQCAP